MGYDVHITRAENWVESKLAPITLDEWIAYIRADHEMRLDGFAEVGIPQGGVLRYENQGLAVWVAYPKDGQHGNYAWFDFGDGRITVKNPDAAILAKMVKIAAHFNAHVQGDEGEFYPLADEVLLEDADKPINRRPWWKRIFRS